MGTWKNTWTQQINLYLTTIYLTKQHKRTHYNFNNLISQTEIPNHHQIAPNYDHRWPKPSTQMSATLTHAVAKSANQTKDRWFCSKEANRAVIHGDFRWVKEGIEEAIEHISWVWRKRGGELFGKVSSIAFTQKQNKAKRGIILKCSIFALVTNFFFF